MWTRREPDQVSRIRVLLVDDHATFLRNATEFLQQQHELVIVGTARGGERPGQSPRATARGHRN